MREKKYLYYVMWMWRYNKKEAKKYIKETDDKILDEIVKAWYVNAEKCFWYD